MARNSNNVRVLATAGLVASMSFTLAAAAAPVTTVRADGVTVTTGAEWVSAPSIPVSKTVDMRSLPKVPAWKPGDPIVEKPRQRYGDLNQPVPVPVNPVFGEDSLASQQRNLLGRRGGGFGTPLLNFNVIASPTVSPNDPTGDIGTLQYVASINTASGSSFAVYDKATGTQIAGPTLMQTLGTGGICAAGAGDPIVLFDELASRWVLTEFTDSGNGLCIYLSNTADLSGAVTWTRYFFTLPAFPDYPKYGVWPDAYYVGANEGATGGQRPFYAMDRVAMLAGTPATLQRLTTPSLTGFSFQMIQPADITGSEAPDAGEPGIFMRHNDDEARTGGTNNPTQDFLQRYEIRVNWATPASSSITGPINIAMPEFSSNLNGLTAFNAFPQPNGQRLDPLRETVMHRLVYRRFDNYEALVGNLVTDLFLGAGSTYPDDTGAVRWFELRRAPPAVPELFADGFEDPGSAATGDWVLHQVGTFAPADGTPAEQTDRWMAASSIDASGNIGLAYNVVRQSPAISAGLRYTGRLAADPPGVMTEGETSIIEGSGNIANERWGDYNDMGVDPVDGCTFWFIGNYATSGARANRVAAFKHDNCVGPTFTLAAAPSSISICAATPTPVAATPVTLNVGSPTGFNQPVALSFPNLPAGITASATPTTVPTLPGSSTIQLSVSNAAAPGRNNVVVRGTSGAIQKNRTIALNVTTAAAGTPTLTAPANAAIAVSATPTFTWQAVPQATSYVVEASTSNTFATTLFSQTTTGTSLVSPVSLPTSTQVFWRVRASNSCGTSANSPVFSFTTAAAPGDCPASSTVVYSEDMEAGAPGWTSAGTLNSWAITTNFPRTGLRAYQAIAATVVSDQQLTTPVINLPAVNQGLFLSFWNRQDLEVNGAAGCWDGGLLEVSVNGGAFTQVTSGLLTNPYNGPLGSGNPLAPAPAWCGTARPYLNSVVDLAAFAGQPVRFRFRLASDTSVANATGWSIDDVRVLNCTP